MSNTKSRITTLQWINTHLEELKLKGEGENIDEVVLCIKDLPCVKWNIGLSKEMLG